VTGAYEYKQDAHDRFEMELSNALSPVLKQYRVELSPVLWCAIVGIIGSQIPEISSYYQSSARWVKQVGRGEGRACAGAGKGKGGVSGFGSEEGEEN